MGRSRCLWPPSPKNLGLKRAVVVHGSDGLDEITTTGKTFISEYNGQEVFSYDITPDELWFKPAKPHDLEGGNLETNVEICNDILNGKKGPKLDIVLLNAAYALYVAEAVPSISKGLDLAKESVDAGKAREKLEQLKTFTQRF